MKNANEKQMGTKWEKYEECECKINDDKWKTNVGKWMYGWSENKLKTNGEQAYTWNDAQTENKWITNVKRQRNRWMVNNRKINNWMKKYRQETSLNNEIVW